MDDSDEESQDEQGAPLVPPVRMTPMELDMQLQIAELIFRGILEGKRMGKHPSDDIDVWHQEVLGDAWVQQNMRQRKEVKRQMRAAGENTPMWLEAQGGMSDLAWEVFEAGAGGEVLRPLKAISRTEVLEQLKELCPKLRESYYARCGAGDRLHGLRACIGVLHLFLRDSEVLGHCADCLRWAVAEHEHNRDALVELTVPRPPDARDPDFADRGWSFLRYALDAFMVQVGADAFGGSPSEQEEGAGAAEGGEQAAAETPAAASGPSRQVALRLAACVVAARAAPAVQTQLMLLREPVPEVACTEHRELKLMVPVVFEKVSQLLAEEPHEALAALLELLRLAGTEEQPLALTGHGGDDHPPLEDHGGSAGGAPGGGDGGEAAEAPGMFQGLAAGVRGLLGRSSN